MESRKKGQTIHSEARNIVRMVIRKCDEEARRGQLRYLLRQANFRASDYTGVSVNTISRIRKEDAESKEGERLASPGKKRRRRSKTILHISEDDKVMIRNIVYDFYIEKKIAPSAGKLLTAIQEKIDFPWKLRSLHRLLRCIGFKWRKSHGLKRILVENPDIVAQRGKYLQAIAYYRSRNRNIIYIGETWVDNTLWFSKYWEIQEIGVQENSSSSHRCIIVHAGGENGFIEGAELIFKENSTTGDYRGKMNSENFEKWVQEKLIPNIPCRTVVVMGNAPYHSNQINKEPSKYDQRKYMIEWLLEHNVPYSEHMMKYELYELIQRYKVLEKTFKADEILKLYGHDVLRLPAHMHELSPIELAWAELKRKIQEQHPSSLTGDKLQTKLMEAMKSITATSWENYCQYTKNTEKTYSERDRLMEKILEELPFLYTENEIESETDSDNDSTSEDSD